MYSYLSLQADIDVKKETKEKTRRRKKQTELPQKKTPKKWDKERQKKYWKSNWHERERERVQKISERKMIGKVEKNNVNRWKTNWINTNNEIKEIRVGGCE